MPERGKKINVSEILKFVEKHVSSFTAWDIILFFFHNQTAIESASSLANRLGRTDKDVKACLRNLVESALLTANDGGTYQYSPTEDLAARVKDFDEALSDSKLRLTILSQVLNNRKPRS